MKITTDSGYQAELPEYVYLITVNGEWPVSAIAADHPSLPDRIHREIQRRVLTGPQRRINSVHVWRVPVMQATEVQLVPEKTIPAELRDL